MTMKTPKDTSLSADATAEIGVARDALWCENCQAETPENEAEALYECGSCSETSTERRCESCNKFKARAEEQGCSNCYEPLTEAQVTVDYDGETILFEDFVEGGEAYSQRYAAKVNADAIERAQKAEVEKTQRLDGSRTATWADLTVGDVIVLADPKPWETPHQFVGYRHALPDGRIIASVYSHRWATDVYDPAAEVLVSTDTAVIDRVTADAAEEPFAGFTRVADGDVDHASSPARGGIRVEIGHATRDGGLLPAIEINSVSGNMLGRIAVLHDPEIAVRVLDVLDQAAADLAAARGTTIDLSAGAEKVAVLADAGWVSSEFDRSATVKVGANSWDREMGAILNIRAGSNITFADPDVVAAAVAEVRARLDHLTMIPKEIG